MFNYIREKFQLWIYHQAQSGREIDDTKAKLSIVSSEDEIWERGDLNVRGTRFSLHSANGGLVIEVDRIDEPNCLYLVTEDQDLAKTLEKIITIERMTQR